MKHDIFFLAPEKKRAFIFQLTESVASINRTSLEATIFGSELLLVLFVSVLAIAGWDRAFSCVSGMTCLNDLLYYEDFFYIAMLPLTLFFNCRHEYSFSSGKKWLFSEILYLFLQMRVHSKNNQLLLPYFPLNKIFD